ncbi:chaperone protein dnaJ 72 [Quercus suber]|uniref:Chaperone protein dnaj 72 n=1 Tax=Quercus suber TaxID=58331 RepID=A0AAW0M2N3_QUESU
MSGTGDHYKVLGLNKNATKDEIKEAFRKLAIKYHPDKHSQSPKPVRENATLRFKLASEAYEVLSDDRKRADYNIRSRSTGNRYGYNSYSYNNNYNNSYSWNGKAYQARYTNRPPGSGSSDFVSRFEFSLRLLTTRAFLLNLGFAGALVGGMFLIDSSMDSIWKTQNSGKSFEEALESIEKTKGSQKSPREAFGSIERVRAYKAMKSTEKAKAISENNQRIN